MSASAAKVASTQQVLYCFDSIIDSLKGEPSKPIIKHHWSGEKFPLFVTWKKRHSASHEWKLRGCIGTFSAKELSAGLREYAVIAAFHDSRFTPIVLSEIAQLRCDISLLTNFESQPVGSILNWTIGTHGIQLDFTSVGHRYSATFLPEVAKEQGWSREETIEELIHKSGFRGSITDALKKTMQITRYQSEKASLSYDEYLALREKLSGVKHVNGIASTTHAAAAGSSSSHHQNGTSHPQHHAPRSSEEDEDEDEDDEEAFEEEEEESATPPPARNHANGVRHK